MVGSIKADTYVYIYTCNYVLIKYMHTYIITYVTVCVYMYGYVHTRARNI